MTTNFANTMYNDLDSRKNKAPEPAGSAAANEEASTGNASGPSVRLVPTGDADSAVVSNYVSISPVYGMAFVDFGFLEPTLLAALQQLSREGQPVPEVVPGKLVARVAMSYDVVVHLHSQLHQLLEHFSRMNEQAAQ